MNGLSETAMVLAAGYGKRLQPLTLTKPKPLFDVGGRTMLDQAIDKLTAFGIKRIVVNCFYLADQIVDHIAHRHDVEIVISREDELLDTGGGVKNALAFFGDKPFFTINSDLPWIDRDEPALSRLANTWDAEKMDSLLLLLPTAKARGFGTQGDFVLTPDGHVWRQNAPVPRPTVWLGAQIVKPALYNEIQEHVFSNNVIWNLCETRHKLFGVLHNGSCFHSGTPQDLAEANRLLIDGIGWDVP